MKNEQPDHVDYKIIEILQQDARTPLKEIARQVFLSSPAVSARIQRLVDAEYITGFHAIVDNKKFGFHIKAFIGLELHPSDKTKFSAFIRSKDCVIGCNFVTGDFSMLLEAVFPSTEKLDDFLNELQQFGKTRTQIVFSTVIEHRGPTISDTLPR